MSTSDAMDAMFDVTNSAYDEILNDAAVDNRVGDHDAVVVNVVNDKWKSGDDRTKLKFILKTANDAKADLTWSPPPPPEVYAAEKASWDRAKLQGVASGITIARQVLEHYGTLPNRIKEGDRFRVKTVKTKRDADGTGGFIRVIAFLPKDAGTGDANGAAPKSPF